MLLPSHISLLLVGRVLCQTTRTVSCLWGISSAFHVRLFVRGIVKFPQCHYFLLQLNLWCIPCLVLLPVLELHNFGYWHLMWSDGYLCCGSFLLLPGLSIERLIDDFTAKDTRYSVLSIRRSKNYNFTTYIRIDPIWTCSSYPVIGHRIYWLFVFSQCLVCQFYKPISLQSKIIHKFYFPMF